MTATVRLTWLQLWRDRRLPVALGLLFTLSLVAVAVDRVRAGASERDRIAAEQVDQKTFAGQGARNPHTVAHFSRFAFRPRSAMSALDPGISDYAGSAVWMEAHSQNPANARAAEDRLDLGRSTDLGLAWIWQVVAPLILIGLAFDAVARERERRTLALVVVGGLPATGLVSAKAAALLAVVGAALAAAALIAVALGTGDAASDPAVRLAVWYGSHLAYLATWTALALAVSVWARTSREALAALLGGWALVVLIVPRLVASLVDEAVPIPTSAQLRAAIEEDLRRGFDGHGPADQRTREFEARVLAEYGVDSVAQLPVSFAGLKLAEGERVGNLVFDKHHRRLAARYRQQRAWRRALGGPLAALQHLSTAAAGTDLEHQLEFVRQAEQQRRDIVGRLNDDMIAHGLGKDFDYQADPDLWRRIPAFLYQPPRLDGGGLVVELAWSMAWLAAAALGLMATARRAAREVGA